MKAERKQQPYGSSIFAKVGMEAMHRAQRSLLLRTLRANRWNLANTGLALKMGGAMHILRQIKRLGLEAEYNAARADGLIRPGLYGVGRSSRTPRLAARDRAA